MQIQMFKKKMKLLKISDILKLQQLKFYYKYKNSKLLHYLLHCYLHAQPVWLKQQTNLLLIKIDILQENNNHNIAINAQ